MACPKRQFVFHWPFTYFCGHDLVTPSKEMKIEMNKAHTEKRAEINEGKIRMKDAARFVQ